MNKPFQWRSSLFLWYGFFLHRLLIKLGRSWCKNLMYKCTKNLLIDENACPFWTRFLWINNTLFWFTEGKLRWKVILYQVVFIFCLSVLATSVCLREALVFSEKSREKRRIYLRISLAPSMFKLSWQQDASSGITPPKICCLVICCNSVCLKL